MSPKANKVVRIAYLARIRRVRFEMQVFYSVGEEAGHDFGGDSRAVLGAGDAGAVEDMIAEGAFAFVFAGDVGHRRQG